MGNFYWVVESFTDTVTGYEVIVLSVDGPETGDCTSAVNEYVCPHVTAGHRVGGPGRPANGLSADEPPLPVRRTLPAHK